MNLKMLAFMLTTSLAVTCITNTSHGAAFDASRLSEVRAQAQARMVTLMFYNENGSERPVRLERNAISLDITGRRRTGQIPANIGELTKLQSISLSNNNLSGSIPSEIGGLMDLREIYLQNNEELDGELILGYTPNLRRIAISDTSITALEVSICRDDSTAYVERALLERIKLPPSMDAHDVTMDGDSFNRLEDFYNIALWQGNLRFYNLSPYLESLGITQGTRIKFSDPDPDEITIEGLADENHLEEIIQVLQTSREAYQDHCSQHEGG